ncbi:hypothetical protein TraAM80_01764 [Trypanosoma rangeli]|uniref:Uncharacterized protein n=1 Tax=Trypanosoma rangeli TaxID=5698 RepID=A0A422NX22_TRYRA|nr:uncharacterized protein TraAM80_01764 [Trypanosoma rangeli]RNF10028.1 hypothetical protein TraAM80_01764 [Trypanosoma rangeli]|eukprot:RNF10028.1 hypothetical protein TraAM80_01764 [Trypanosoma rangeli]
MPEAVVTARRTRVASRRWRQWVHRVVWVIVWWVGAVLVGKLHQDSVKMYVAVTVMLGIFALLNDTPREKMMEATDAGVGNAPKFNKTETVVSGTAAAVVASTASLAVVNTSGTVVRRGASVVENQCAIFAALKAIGTPQALRAIWDDALLESILCSPLDAPLCCCGSGKRFARCCRLLQAELRGCGL